MTRLRYTIGTYRELRRAARALQRAAGTARTPSDALAALKDVRTQTPISPVQIDSELIDFLALVQDERPRRVLEIGTGNGGTLYLLCWAAAPTARIVSLDLRPIPSGRRRLYRAFARRRQRLAVWTADSHASQTRDDVLRFLGGQPLDVLLIDGDHSYDGVKRDYELYAPLLRPGGLVALHDIVDGPESAVGGVPGFWREVRGSLADPRELVESWSQGGYGIGVGRAVAR